MNLEPYQQAGQEIQRQNLRPLNAIKSIGAGTSVLKGGEAIAKRVLPFLSQ